MSHTAITLDGTNKIGPDEGIKGRAMTVEYADEVEENLANWGKGLFDKIPVGGLFARNPLRTSGRRLSDV